MGITPIEMYTMVPKSQEASGVRQSQHTQGQNQQQGIVNHINSEIMQNSMKPVKANEAEKENYRYDAKEKGNGGYSGNGKKKKKGNESEKKEDEHVFKRNGFDVRI